MKAQELRDRLAAVRDFVVKVDGKKIEEVVINISDRRVYISTTPIPEAKEKGEKKA